MLLAILAPPIGACTLRRQDGGFLQVSAKCRALRPKAWAVDGAGVGRISALTIASLPPRLSRGCESICRQALPLYRNVVRRCTIQGKQRCLPTGQELADVRGHSRPAESTASVIENRIAKQDDLRHLEWPSGLG